MTDRAPVAIPTLRSVTDEHRAEVLRAMNRTTWRWGAFADYARTVIIAVALFMLARTFVMEAFKIPSASMEKTLLVGDFLLVNKAVYGAEIPFTHLRMPAFREPRRGEVIVFHFPKDRVTPYVKRLIGLPGDTVEMRNDTVLVNGIAQSEPYVEHVQADSDQSLADFDWQRNFLVTRAEASAGYHPSRNTWGPLIVPRNSYFVLGDNRDISSDSRYWGFVPQSLLIGRPMFVYYSYAHDDKHSYPWLTDIRWHRLGTIIH